MTSICNLPAVLTAYLCLYDYLKFCISLITQRCNCAALISQLYTKSLGLLSVMLTSVYLCKKKSPTACVVDCSSQWTVHLADHVAVQCVTVVHCVEQTTDCFFSCSVLFIIMTLVSKSRALHFLFWDIVALQLPRSSADYLCLQCTLNDIEMLVQLFWPPDSLQSSEMPAAIQQLSVYWVSRLLVARMTWPHES